MVLDKQATIIIKKKILFFLSPIPITGRLWSYDHIILSRSKLSSKLTWNVLVVKCGPCDWYTIGQFDIFRECPTEWNDNLALDIDVLTLSNGPEAYLELGIWNSVQVI